ncbi:hypothetical protein ACFC09_31435, partial [Streptomyces sp. NPDC056161]|uniref:hypothetical protein n=1 Tax=Streptomyces sp. NPDC056161 TaxID=3345732 RepID=UPI0035DD8188
MPPKRPQKTRTDYTRAIIEAYELLGHTGTAQPPILRGYRPNVVYKVLGTKLGRRMADLSEKETKSRAGKQEAAALAAAGIPLRDHGDGTLSIHPDTPKTSQLGQQGVDNFNAMAVIEAYQLLGHTGTAQPPITYGHLPSNSYQVLGLNLGQRMHSLAKKDTQHRVGPQEAAALAAAGIPLRDHGNGTLSIHPDTPKMADYFNARAVTEAYQLPGHTGKAQPPIPHGHLPKSTYQVLGTNLGKRMHNLAKKDTDSRVGPKEAVALVNAGIKLRDHGNGTWSIHPDTPRASQLDKQMADYFNARAITEAYQLPGHTGTAQPPIPLSHLPSDNYEVPGTSVGQLMANLIEEDADARVEEQDAAAPTDADTTLLEHSNSTQSIHPDTPKTSQLDQQSADDFNAIDVSEEYQLPGHTGTAQPPIPLSHLPSNNYEVPGTSVGQLMANLIEEDADARVEEQDTAAPTDADTTLLEHSNSTQSIHPDTPKTSQLD